MEREGFLAMNPNLGDENGFRFLLDKVRRNRGIDFSQYRSSVLKRRIEYRLHMTGCTTYWDYVLLLNKDPAEYDRLLDALTIKVSRFFRDPEVFKLLGETVIPEVLFSKRAAGAKTIRAWSCGTAFGQEVYSVVILLCEALGRRLGGFDVRIIATDIDEAALEKAQWGSYDRDALRAIRADWLFKYFTLAGDRYVVNDHARTLITFKRHNVVADGPEPGMDLVLCRNVLIYLEKDLQRKALESLHEALNPGGFLILGKVETMPPDILRRFEVVDLRERVYRKRGQ